jgi:hypothetical protein
MRPRRALLLLLLVGTLPAAGACAASRSELRGGFGSGARADAVTASEPVTVAFIFTHAQHSRGWDVVPKIHHANRHTGGFFDLFGDALPELATIASYETFADRADDVTSSARRAERAALTGGSHDFVIYMRFLRETSFARQAAGSVVSALTLTLVPVPYPRTYTLTVDVRDRDGRAVKRYERAAAVTNWVGALLLPAYPFHPEARKTEEAYLEFLRDVFREIEADGILARR